MSQVGAAGSAEDFCAGHPETIIFDIFDGILADGLKIAGPSCSGVKFGVRAEERCFAALAEIGARGFLIPVFILERGLGAMVEADIVFERRQLFLEFFPVKFDRVGHDNPCVLEIIAE